MANNKVIIPAPESDCAKCMLFSNGECPAFSPDPIPANILNGKETHRKPVAGQRVEFVVFDMKDEYRYPSL